MAKIDRTALAIFWDHTEDEKQLVCMRPGKAMTLSSFSEDEEGYIAKFTTYFHEGNKVRRQYGTRQKDCDGLLETGGEDICYLSQLEDGYEDDEGACWPIWRTDPELPKRP